MDVCIILCLTFGAQNIPMCFRLPADNNSLGWLILWNLKTTICQRFCITFQLHNMGRDLQTLKRVSWKTIYIYLHKFDVSIFCLVLTHVFSLRRPSKNKGSSGIHSWASVRQCLTATCFPRAAPFRSYE